MTGSPWAASEVLWAETAQLALQQGHEVLVSTFGWKDRPAALGHLERSGAVLESRPASQRYRRSAFLVRLTGAFARLQRFKPDVVCVSQGGTYDIARSGNAAVLRSLLKQLGAPYVVMCHCEQPPPPKHYHARAREFFHNATTIGMLADRLRVVSERHLGTPLPNVRVFHNPVNLARIEYLPWPVSAEIRFASVGRLDPVKNIGALIEALSAPQWRERRWSLTVYGAGPDRPKLEEEVNRKLLTDRIRFAGYVNDIAAVWATHHVLLMPSRFEGVPLAMIEAMLCGRTVVATDVGGIGEWIEEGRNGFLIADHTTPAIANALERLWSSRDTLESMGIAAHERTLAKRDSRPAQTLLNWITNAALLSPPPTVSAYDSPSNQPADVELPASSQKASRNMKRPLISVVIPTYEPQQLLVDTLRSVLAQDPGPDTMQIAIVDDGSPTVRVADLIEQAAPSRRIEIHQYRDNAGLGGNWNRAIEVARGEYVHILHQDDGVRAGFYARLAAGLSSSPQVGMAFCRHAFTDKNDMIDRISHRERFRPGVLPNWLERIAEKQRIQCPSAVVKRDVYERLGGFRQELVYALDWEMWVRIAAKYDVWYEPEVLAHYRRHNLGQTAKLEATGRTYEDLFKAIEMFAVHLPPDRRGQIKKQAYRRLARTQIKRASKLLKGSLPERAAAQIGYARRALERVPEDLAKRWQWSKLLRLEAQLANYSAQSPG